MNVAVSKSTLFRIQYLDAVAAPPINKVGPIGPTIFVQALPHALPLGPSKTKKLKPESPTTFSIMLMIGRFLILRIYTELKQFSVDLCIC